jgi:cytochrome c oxidase subunit 2
MTLAGLGDWLHNIWFKPANSDLAVDGDGNLLAYGVDWLFMYILWISIISFVLLMVPMCWWAFKYRRRPGHVQQRTPNHNTALEITWVLVPLALLVPMFFWGFHGYMKVQIAPGNAEVINIIGKKWNWTAIYASGASPTETVYIGKSRTRQNADGKESAITGNTPVPVIYVPEGRAVRFKMISDDVIHSFFIPDMRVKMDVFPNRYTSLSFTSVKNIPVVDPITKKASYHDHEVYCAEYCGDSHSEMAAVVRVLPEGEYAAKMEEISEIEGGFQEKDGKPGKRGNKPLWQLGEILYNAKGCAQCHSIDGSAKTGPSWKGYYGKPVEFARESGEKLDLSTEAGWENYIRESILLPQAKIHKGFENGNMPSYQGQLSEKAISGITAYIKKLNQSPAK